MTQLDLFFLTARKQPNALDFESFSERWNEILAGSMASNRIRFHVSAAYTGQVAERMNEPGDCMRLLWANGLITEYGPALPDGEPLRTIYATRSMIEAIHRNRGLICDRWETTWAWYRLADDGETPDAELLLPHGTEGQER